MEEQNKREATVRHEMRILNDALKKRKEKSQDDDKGYFKWTKKWLEIAFD